MKSVLAKIKANKFRSAMIGTCIFLFGFISITIFSNINDTYAAQTCWACDRGGGRVSFQCASSNPNSNRCSSASLSKCGGCSGTTKTYTVTLNGSGGSVSTPNGKPTTTCTTKEGSDTCTVNLSYVSAKKEGYTFNGWGTSGCINGNKGTYSVNSNTILYACFSSTGAGYNDVTTSNPDTEEDVEPIIINYYTITYHLNGGKWIDGTTTSRAQIVPDNKSVGSPTTNPIKERSKFIGWELDGKPFDFNSTISSNITLSATYEEVNDYDNYTCNNDDIFDYSTKSCYKVLKADNTNECSNADKTYNYTTITYPENSRYCWNYKKGVHDGAFHIHQGIDGTVCGQNNQEYAGYGKSDSWMSDNTCFIASPCQNNSDWKDASSCTIKWQSILFDSYDATYDERIGDGKQDNGEKPDENDSTNNNSNKVNNNNSDKANGGNVNNSDKTNDEIDKNSKTGDALIQFVWIIGICALGYSIYYFKNKKQEN